MPLGEVNLLGSSRRPPGGPSTAQRSRIINQRSSLGHGALVWKCRRSTDKLRNPGGFSDLGRGTGTCGSSQEPG